jgi:hypothetical protein
MVNGGTCLTLGSRDLRTIIDDGVKYFQNLPSITSTAKLLMYAVVRRRKHVFKHP